MGRILPSVGRLGSRGNETILSRRFGIVTLCCSREILAVELSRTLGVLVSLSDVGRLRVESPILCDIEALAVSRLERLGSLMILDPPETLRDAFARDARTDGFL